MPETSIRPDDMAAVRRWARMLDSQFRVPGTNIRFGWDPILGLVPGLGDMVGPVFAAVLLVHAWKVRVPKVIMARMLANAAIDAALGAVPLLGDAVDVFWKANQSNVRLLERHAASGASPRAGDWIFVGGVVVLLAAIVLLPIVLVVWIGRQLL
jgi:hypothetical protein